MGEKVEGESEERVRVGDGGDGERQREKVKRTVQCQSMQRLKNYSVYISPWF